MATDNKHKTNNIVKKTDIQYPLELFIKYRHINNHLPKELDPFIKPDNDIPHHSCLQLPEIRAYLNSHMSKKNMNGEDEALFNRIQGLLNKLSNTNFSDISCDIKELPYSKRKHIYKLCEAIVLKSINEPSYSDIYAKLSNTLLQYSIVEHKTVDDKKVDDKVYFRLCLLTICQDIFEQLTNNKPIIKSFDYERSTDYSKLKLSGLMKCIAELYNSEVIVDKIILQCFNVIFTGVLKGNDYYDALSVFVLTLLKKVRQSSPSVYTKIRSSVVSLIEADKTGELLYDGVNYPFKFGKSVNKFKIVDTIDGFNNTA